MDIEVIEASPEQPDILANLLELYVYDFSEFTGRQIGPDGRYGQGDVGRFWSAVRQPYLAKAGGVIAGFAIVERGSALTGDAGVTDMLEFFVMRTYRRRGVGETFARTLFDRYRGRWEVRVMDVNTPAQAFWRAVVDRYTGGRFDERAWDEDRWRGPVLSFDSSRATT